MVRLLPINRGNWEKVLRLTPAPSQENFLPPVAESLLHAHYEGLTANAIYDGLNLVGYVIYGPVGGVPWVSRVLVDAQWQHQGYANEALALVLARLRLLPNAHEVRTSLATGNDTAERLFARHGFQRTGYEDGHEFVMRLEVRD